MTPPDRPTPTDHAPTSSAGAPPPAPSRAKAPRLPWRVVPGIAAGALLACLAAWAAAGPLAVPATAGGMVLGLGGTLLGSSGRAAAGGALVLALSLLHLAAPGIDLHRLALALPAAAGWETAQRGGRAFTMALMSLGLLVAAQHAGAAPGLALPSYGAGLLAGLGLARVLGLARMPARPPEGPAAGLRHTLFLGLGLALAVALAGHLQNAHSIWLVQFFVLRGLAPGHMARASALQFALGVLAGTAAALVIETAGLGLPPWGILLALAALVAGLRSLPAGPPLTPALMTVALLLLTAPTPDAALFRGEAAIMASGLAILLATVLDLLFRPRGAGHGR
ncbi:hypothetical protein [Mangrovicoccus algicola]|uniref:Uncharacterized protein n=1 Tax=Mangrovicoccus algicola TaxID=2771008 RepID=A0A8J6Z0M4_9RHOB|nr:hypothetical protein [Mangrovicoccus algicola]MBE3639351.1 hypothetical protein [Mangrovicoccus algicola]